MKSLVFGVFALLASTILIGCGGGADLPDMGTVTGTVTLDGQPLPGVQVGFEPEGVTEGRPSMGTTDEQGNYELSYNAETKGAIVGMHTVRVTTPQDAPDPTGSFKDPIPPKFNRASTLKKEVVAGENQIDLELTSK